MKKSGWNRIVVTDSQEWRKGFDSIKERIVYQHFQADTVLTEYLAAIHIGEITNTSYYLSMYHFDWEQRNI